MRLKHKKFFIFFLTFSLIVSSAGFTSFSVSAEDLNIEQTIETTDPGNPDPENPDSENPDPENPDPEITDPENPDPENPDPEITDPEITDPENPDPENPDPENPDPENPDPENPDPEDPDPEDPENNEDSGLKNYYTVTETIKLNLKYDDRYTIDTALTDYQLLTTEEETITSYVVSGGKAKNDLDKQLLTLKKGSQKDYIATAVGTADLIFVSKEDAKLVEAEIASQNKVAETETEIPDTEESDIEESDIEEPDTEEPGTEVPDTEIPEVEPPAPSTFEKVPAIKLHVTVKPAVLTLMYLAGQSNMEGVCANLNWQPKNSIACTAGTVYSSYGYKSIDRGASTTGLSITNEMSAANVLDFVPESLTSDTSVSGVRLQYPLTSLTTEGKGKTGPDSGIAYEWNRLTKQKVWAVNCAYGGSDISRWASDGNCYERAYKLFNQINKIYNAEISAGHYQEGERLFFWQQGEANTSTPIADYRTWFLSMYNGFRNTCQFSHFGIITTRCSNDHTTKKSIAMAPPRITQYYYGGKSGLKNVYIVSNENEKWTTDANVKTYFTNRYPSGYFTYPKRKGNSLKELPKQVWDVHPDIHFSQEAHNENGISAANGMYKILYGKTTGTTPSVKWIDQNGDTLSSLKIAANEKLIVVPAIYPGYCAKDVSVVIPSGVSYTPETGYMNFTTSGTKKILIKDSSGATLNTLTVTAVVLPAPKITDLHNASTGVSITWKAVDGAGKYRVYRKKGSGSWTKLADTTATNYTDKTAVSGDHYSYTVRCLNAAGNGYTSSYDTKGWSIDYLSAPEISSVKNVTAGVQLTWKTVKKATGYIIYRKTGSESYKTLKTIQNAATKTFTDQKAVHGKLYEYKILAYNSDTKSGSFTPYPTMFRMKTPALKSLKNNKAGTITLTYATDSSVTGYQYYYMDPVSNKKVSGTVTNKNTASIVVSKLKKGKTYGFYFRTYRKTGENTYYAAWSNPYNIKVTK